MKKTWIALTLAGALCVPLAGCAGDKTGSNLMPSVSPTTQVTPNMDSDNSALEEMGEGIKDTLDDLGAGARSMAQDTKRAME